jgi:hypothetical protein
VPSWTKELHKRLEGSQYENDADQQLQGEVCFAALSL